MREIQLKEAPPTPHHPAQNASQEVHVGIEISNPLARKGNEIRVLPITGQEEHV